MEYGIDLPLGGNSEVEGHVGNDFLYFEQASSFHLELLWSIHVEVSGLEPHFVTDFPRCELRGDLFLHFLLGHLVGGLSIVSGHR